MAKNENFHRFLFHFEGSVDEVTLVFIIRKISEEKKLPGKIKSNLKFIFIELITNMISHHVGDSYGVISAEREKDHYLITASNISSEQNFKIINANLDTIKKIKNVKGYYNEQLKSVSYDKSVNLGLIEIYNRCNGNIKVTSKPEGRYLNLTFKIKLNDIN